MRKFTLTVATALLAAACHDATQPDPGIKPEFAVGSTFECVGVVHSGTFDNVVVPPGAFCLLQDAIVAGNIKALESSHLLINRGARVGGDIEGDKADVQLLAIGNNARNLVHGSIQIKGAGAVALVCGTDLPQGEIRLEKNTGFVHAGGVTCDGFGEGNTLPNGRIRIKKNIIPTTRSLEITGNVVGGDLEVLKNEGLALSSCKTTR